MADVKQIVCLANSRKLAGRCIAGREWTTESGAGNWIRPVSKRDNREVSEYERQYEDGSDPQVLDIVQVPVLAPKPHSFQTENWLLDDEYYWHKVGRFSQLELPKIADPVEPLWADGYSTYNGRNDKIPLGIGRRGGQFPSVHSGPTTQAVCIRAWGSVRECEAARARLFRPRWKPVCIVGDRPRIRENVPCKAQWHL